MGKKKAVTSATKRRFEYHGGSSHKYWTIWKHTSNLVYYFTTHWGRIGTKGQLKEKSFSSKHERDAAYKKIINQKLKKGYIEVNLPVAGVGGQKPHINLKPAVKVVNKKQAEKKSPKITMPDVGPKPADHDNIIVEENDDPFMDHLDNLELE